MDTETLARRAPSEQNAPDSVPNYSYVFEFERDFEHLSVKPWMQENWATVCSYAAGAYVLFLCAGEVLSILSCN